MKVLLLYALSMFETQFMPNPSHLFYLASVSFFISLKIRLCIFCPVTIFIGLQSLQTCFEILDSKDIWPVLVSLQYLHQAWHFAHRVYSFLPCSIKRIAKHPVEKPFQISLKCQHLICAISGFFPEQKKYPFENTESFLKCYYTMLNIVFCGTLQPTQERK